MRATRIRIVPVQLTTLKTARQYLGLYDDRSMDDHVESLRKSAEETVRSYLNRPVEGDEVFAWWPSWPEDGQALQVTEITTVPAMTRAEVQYMDAGNSTRQLGQDKARIDYSADGVIMLADDVYQLELSTRVQNPVQARITEVGSNMRKERVKEAVMNVMKELYGGDAEAALTPSSVKQITGQLLGSMSIVSLD